MKNIIEKYDTSRLDAAIEAASVISVISHIRPDGDAIGSSIAMLKYLQNRGKDVRIVYSDRIPDTLSFMDCLNEGEILTAEENGIDACSDVLAKSDLLICLDFNLFSRTGDLADILRESNAVKVLIDHHLYPESELFDIVFSEPERSSACELLYYVLLSMPDVGGDPAALPKESATALMTGMTTDTNNFSNSTSPSTFAMASGLLEAGVDRDAVISNIYNSYRESRIRLMGYLLHENLKITPEGVAYMILLKDVVSRFGIKEGESEGFVNIPLAIADVKISIFVKEDEDGVCRVSLRSKKGWSSNKLAMRYFHGGGHECASGGKILCPEDVESLEGLEQFVADTVRIFFKEEGYE